MVLWKVVANKLYVVICKPNGPYDIKCIWELDDHEPHYIFIFKFQKQKVLLIMDNSATHSLKHVGRGESFGFPTLQLSNIIISYLPLNFTSVVQPLDQGMIASYNVQYKKKLLEWISSQFDSSSTYPDLMKTVPNVRQAIMWRPQV